MNERKTAAMNGNLCVVRAGWVLAIVLLGAPGIVRGQAKEQPAPNEPSPSAAIKIEDLPRTVDPATLLPARLTKSVTVEFPDASLGDVVKWLQTEQKVGVIIEQGTLAGEAVTDKLVDAPLYLLLDRLRTIGIGWYYEANIVHLTTLEAANEHMTNVSYNVSDLLDKGYDSDALIEVISDTVSPDSWQDGGGKASVQILGDVLFVNQSQELQLQVAGLLSALRKHGRRTYIADSPGHEPLRTALASVTSVDLHEVPLAVAIERLAKQVKVEIRLNQSSLRAADVRDRQPVSLTMADQKSTVILQALLNRLKLTWVIRDGVIWIESQASDAASVKTAVYDVRDLCRDKSEAHALKETICSQLESSAWEDGGGSGHIAFPLPGVMVVSQTEAIHDRLLELLENYRAALRVSKPRPRAGENPQEVITRYYRLPKTIADDLVSALPQLVEPDSWRSDAKPAAAGTILKLASKSEWETSANTKGSDASSSVLVPYAVLVIKQTRAVHDLIPDVLQKVQAGDAAPFDGGLGGGGLGGGGFGGGFF